MAKLRSAAHTDIGKVRRQNEDRFLQDDVLRAYGVADGVGGLPGGAEAAQLAVDEITTALREVPLEAEADLVVTVHRANEAVGELGRKISPAMGIGCTLTFAQVHHDELRLVHVGDSRAYALRDGFFEMLTEDHSVENEARQRRARGEVVYYHESNRNALTRCIGQPTPPLVDQVTRPLAARDRYVFCTDGVTRLIRDRELGEILNRGTDPMAIAREMVDLAVHRGGPDNATVVILFVDELG